METAGRGSVPESGRFGSIVGGRRRDCRDQQGGDDGGSHAQDILIRARATEAGDRLGDRDDDRDKTRQALVRDSAACAVSSPPTDGGGGGGDGGGGGGGDNEPSVTERCDPFDASACLYPWPNDYFTKPASTPTGRQLNLNPLSMPSNQAGIPLLPEPFNRSDGFSPGNLIATKVPGLDTQAELTNDTGAAPITEVEESLELDQPIVVINADTGERQLIFSEIDANPSPTTRIARSSSARRRTSRRATATSSRCATSRTRAARSRADPVSRTIATARRPGTRCSRPGAPHMEQLFDELAEAAGSARNDLYLAWDFTVASRQNLSERALYMRDDAFAQLGDTDLSDMNVPGASEAPAFTVDTVTTDASGDPEIGRVVEGTFDVPCYLNLPGCPTGSQFLFQPGSNLPLAIPGNTMSANFVCIIRKRGRPTDLDPPASRPSLYGHGLLGTRARSRAETSRRWPASTTSPSAPPTGPGSRPGTRRPSFWRSRTSTTSPSSSTARSRGSSISCTSGG